MTDKEILQYQEIASHNNYVLYLNNKTPTRLKPSTTLPSNEMYFYETVNIYNPTQPHLSENIIKITDFEEKLTPLGLCVMKKKEKGIHDTNPMLYHEIKIYKEGIEKDKDFIKRVSNTGPQGGYVQYDTKNKCARYVGRLAWPNRRITDWTYTEKQQNTTPPVLDMKDYEDPFQYMEDLDKIVQKKPIIKMQKKKIENLLPIGDVLSVSGLNIPQGVTLCIPLTKDQPSIVIAGTKGRGKTVLSVTIATLAYLHGIKLIIGNDNLNKFWTWIYPAEKKIEAPPIENQTATIIRPWKQWQKYGLTPRGLPCNYHYPNYLDPTKKETEIMYKNKAGFQFTLSWKKLIENLHKYASLGGSDQKYKQIKPKLMQCKNREEFEELMNYYMDKKNFNQHNIPIPSIAKIREILTNLLELGLVDLENDIPSMWRVKNKKGEIQEFNPIIASTLVGAVPIIVTEKILDTPEWPITFLYILEDLREKMRQHPWFSKEKVWIFIDEIKSLLSIPNPKGGNALLSPAAPEIEKLPREGRNIRLGSCYILQNFTDLAEGIQQNTTYFITFENKTEGDEFVKQYKVDKKWSKEVARLKRFEFIACASDQYILLYPDGTQKPTRGPIKARVLFPLCRNSPPDAVAPK